ncbi:hypothetical protein GQR58_008831 [Nymphon striatum]|nr:hypothetical protein GQR58_008831 [Nymphon striatum]
MADFTSYASNPINQCNEKKRIIIYHYTCGKNVLEGYESIICEVLAPDSQYDVTKMAAMINVPENDIITRVLLLNQIRPVRSSCSGVLSTFSPTVTTGSFPCSKIDSTRTIERNWKNSVLLLSTRRKFCQLAGVVADPTTRLRTPIPRFALAVDLRLSVT